MDCDYDRDLAARAARLAKDRLRPVFRVSDSVTLRGLLPQEIEDFYSGVAAARGRADREYAAHVRRTGKMESRDILRGIRSRSGAP